MSTMWCLDGLEWTWCHAFWNCSISWQWFNAFGFIHHENCIVHTKACIILFHNENTPLYAGPNTYSCLTDSKPGLTCGQAVSLAHRREQCLSQLISSIYFPWPEPNHFIPWPKPPTPLWGQCHATEAHFNSTVWSANWVFLIVLKVKTENINTIAGAIIC